MKDTRFWIALLATVVGLAGACFSPLLFFHFMPAEAVTGHSSVISLSILAFAGVTGLLAMLTLMACTFAALEITDKEQALGLPEGSIRAVIALSLIVIFVISSLFLFGRLADGEMVELPGLTAEQVAQIPGSELVAKTPDASGNTFTVRRRIGPTAASEDFSRQFLTTISTLVVAIASFYFGSKAVQSGRAATADLMMTWSDKEAERESNAPTDKATPPKEEPGGSSPHPVAPIEVKTPAPFAEKPPGEFAAKRMDPDEVPPSSGVLVHTLAGKLQVASGIDLAVRASLSGGFAGEITADHWLSTAQRERIGTGENLNPEFLVIHYTEGYGAEGSISGWREKKNGILSHVVVDRDGKIFQCRPFNQVCGHAGRGRWRNPATKALVEDLNERSIGIEIANTGDGGDDLLHERLTRHFPDAQIETATHRNARLRSSNASEHQRTEWEAYPKAQLEAVFGLVKLLLARYPIVDITGHDCIAYERKTDPGPLFPMERLREENGEKGLPTVWDKSGKALAV